VPRDEEDDEQRDDHGDQKDPEGESVPRRELPHDSPPLNHVEGTAFA